jgi:hypothetical protein
VECDRDKTNTGVLRIYSTVDEVKSFALHGRRAQETTQQPPGSSLAPPTLADNLGGNLLIEERSGDGATNLLTKGACELGWRRKEGRPAAQACILEVQPALTARMWFDI